MIKLLAVSRKVDGSFYAMVSPVLVGPSDPLYSVNGVFNAIFVHGNVLGEQCSTEAEPANADRKCCRS